MNNDICLKQRKQKVSSIIFQDLIQIMNLELGQTFYILVTQARPSTEIRSKMLPLDQPQKHILPRPGTTKIQTDYKLIMYFFFNIKYQIIFYWFIKLHMHPMFRYKTITKPVMVKDSYAGYSQAYERPGPILKNQQDQTFKHSSSYSQLEEISTVFF